MAFSIRGPFKIFKLSAGCTQTQSMLKKKTVMERRENRQNKVTKDNLAITTTFFIAVTNFSSNISKPVEKNQKQISH